MHHFPFVYLKGFPTYRKNIDPLSAHDWKNNTSAPARKRTKNSLEPVSSASFVLSRAGTDHTALFLRENERKLLIETKTLYRLNAN